MGDLIKTIRLRFNTWKRLSLLKLDGGFDTMDEAVNSILEKEGY